MARYRNITPQVVEAMFYDGTFDLGFLRSGEHVRRGINPGEIEVTYCSDSGATATTWVTKNHWLIRLPGYFRVMTETEFAMTYRLEEPEG